METLGYHGKMISGSKSGYSSSKPKNLPVFNSNVIASLSGELVKIWHGDIDITLSIEKLKELSTHLDAEIYVLREMDARFENENNPRIENFVVKITRDEVELGKLYEDYYDLETLTKKEIKAINHAKLMANKGQNTNVVDLQAFKDQKDKKAA